MNHQNNIKQWLRIRLGILQMVHKAFLSLLLIPIIVLFAVVWNIEDTVLLVILEIPSTFIPFWKFFYRCMNVLLSILVLFFVLETIGNFTARRDERNLAEAFDNHDLRNGCPILMDKKSIKGSNVMIREFYSSIPMKVWVTKQEYIADSMNVHFVEPIQYGGKSNGRRIVMYTASGRATTPRGNLYDEEF